MKTNNYHMSEPVRNQEETITMFVEVALPSYEKTDPVKEIPPPKKETTKPEAYFRRYIKG